jgi:7-cyano-7-deazaguanosine (preQ0) biosynthesis protein QueE
MASNSKGMLIVNEVFGPTFQGEGKNIGKPTYFLRVTGCNQHCQWCDTAYTWRFSDAYPHVSNVVYEMKNESHPMEIMDVFTKLMDMDKQGHRSLVISGGEPMLQQNALAPLISALKSNRWYVEMETAGSVTPKFDDLGGLDEVSLFNVSVKLSNSGNPRDLSINPVAIRALLTHKTAWKFVVSNSDDMAEVNAIVDQFSIRPSCVYIMPEGVTTEAIANRLRSDDLIKHVIGRGYNLTTRLQIAVYGNLRGV